MTTLPENNKSSRFGLFSGLSRTLVMSFLLLSLLPLLVINFVNNKNVQTSVLEMQINALDTALELKRQYLKTFFTERTNDLLLQSDLQGNIDLLEQLSSAFSQQAVPLERFIKSYDYLSLVSDSTTNLVEYQLINGYYDILLLDLKGNILFSVAGEDDLGTNILTGPYRSSNFGEVAGRAMESGQPQCSELGFYQTSANIEEATIFLAQVMANEDGDPIGIMVFQIALDKLNSIMQDYTGLGETGQTFLVGKDFLLRSSLRNSDSNGVLQKKVDSQLTRNLFVEDEKVEDEKMDAAATWEDKNVQSQLSSRTDSYIGQSGNPVNGIGRNMEALEKLGLHWLMVAEIDKKETFAPVQQLSKLALTGLLITALLVFFLAILLSRRIIKPIAAMSNWARQVALGDLSKVEIFTQHNEIGVMAECMTTVVDSLKDTARKAESIAEGNFQIDISLRSERDELGLALQNMTATLQNVVKQASVIAGGDFNADIVLRSDKDELGIAIQTMTRGLKAAAEENQRSNWFKSGQAELAEQMRGDKDIFTLSTDIITFLAKYLDLQVGTFFIVKEDGYLHLNGSYSFARRKELVTEIKQGEGLVGQAALERQYILLSEVPEDYLDVASSLGHARCRQILAMPVLMEEKVMGVMELGSLAEFSEKSLQFLQQVSENIAITINSVLDKDRTKELLVMTQKQAVELEEQQTRLQENNAELQAQQEALQAANEELHTKQEELQENNERLLTQEEELRVTNEELEEKSRSLTRQKTDIEAKNLSLAEAKEDLIRKGRELELSSKYKSEFLANMSHELRTPLNSLLLISKKLSRNKDGNLSEKQVQAAEIVYNSGNSLLALINEILDLAKIESGKMDITISAIRYSDIQVNMENLFGPAIKEKGLEFTVNIDSSLPESMQSDQQRLEQILRNFLSNAVKFTEVGNIHLEMCRPDPDIDLSRSGLSPAQAVAFKITDSGIGIPEDKQLLIFEAFQQVDGSTSRQYGGTGLGLSITKELAKLLGGEIQLESKMGAGSTFTAYIAEHLEEISAGDEVETGSQAEVVTAKLAKVTVSVPKVPDEKYGRSINDDRNSLGEKDHVVLVIEDDMSFAQILYETCHEKNLKCIHAAAGEKGLALAKEYQPDAVILDMGLPGIQGDQVLAMLKDDTTTRHIPVHILSAAEKSRDVFLKGAIGYLTKPVTDEQLSDVFSTLQGIISKGVKDLLIVEDNEELRASIQELHESAHIHVTTTGKGKKALELIKGTAFDCMILDLRLPDISGFEVLKEMAEMKGLPTPPVIVYTGKELSRQEQNEINKYADSVVLKGVMSDERLIDETTLFLHTVIEDLGKSGQSKLSSIYDTDSLLKDKKVLIVDDDMRNLFALTDELEEFNMKVIKATNGKEALKVLQEDPEINIVLMDIMMPVMDGFEAIRQIRNPKSAVPNHNIPILALTAKAMREDREKCIEAGANDYMPKPVDIDRLLSTMRVWLKG